MASVAVSLSRLLDPAVFALLALIASLWLATRAARRLSFKRTRIALRFAWAAAAVLWLLSTPWFSSRCVAWLQPEPADLGIALRGTDRGRRVLIVLGGGMRTPIYDMPPMERLTGPSLARTLGAARIYREHGFSHIIVSGGAPPSYVRQGFAETEAGAMRDLLVALGVPVERIYLEDRSTNTQENAVLSVSMVRSLSVDTAVLVTSAVHIPRAQWEFARAGLETVAAPVDFIGRAPSRPDRFLPSSDAFLRSNQAVHELLGRLRPE